MKIRYVNKGPEGTLYRANPEDAGADLKSSEDATIPPLSRATICTGLFLEIPEGYYGRVAPRSGLAHKHGVDILAGVVDSSYRGEIKVIVHNTDKEKEFQILRGDKIAQLIVERHYNFELVETQDLSDTARGEKGFGSTG
jgi:dUTP pyrophosphatase